MLIVGILFFYKYSKNYAFKSNRAFDIHHKRGSLQKGAYHVLPAEGGSSSLSRTSLKIQDRCPSLSCPLDSLPPGGQAVPGYLTPRPGYLNPRGASCPGRFILPPAHIKKILLCDVYYYLQHYNNYMQFLSYNYVNLNDYFKHSVGFLIDKGWGASCPGRFILPPT